jgi:hypothetical protein
VKPLRPIASSFSVIKRYRFRVTLFIAIAWTVIDSLFYLFHLAYHEPSRYALFQERTAQEILLRELNVFFLSMFMAYLLIFLLRNFFRELSFLLKIFFKSLILIMVALTMNFFIYFTYATLIDHLDASVAIETFYRNTFHTSRFIEKTPEWIILFVLT